MRRVALAALFALVVVPARAQELVYPYGGKVTRAYSSSHLGLDVNGTDGGEVHAARSGKVSSVRAGSTGVHIIIAHGSGYTTGYVSLRRATVAAGAAVTRATKIALAGTGSVHFEVRRYGAARFVPGAYGSTIHRGWGLPWSYPGLTGSQAIASQTPPSSSDERGELFRLHNGDRSKHGVKALAWSDTLASAAAFRAKDLLTRNYFSHYDPSTGKLAFIELFDRRGVHPWTTAGENLAWSTNPTTMSEIDTAFMNSPEHRDNILDPHFRHVGIGIAANADKTYIAVIFSD